MRQESCQASIGPASLRHVLPALADWVFRVFAEHSSCHRFGLDVDLIIRYSYCMSTTITATEAARSFSDLLNRVRYRGETFRIVRSGEEVAQLTAASSSSGTTLRELLGKLQAEGSGDPDFADDLERIQAGQPKLVEDPWDS